MSDNRDWATEARRVSDAAAAAMIGMQGQGGTNITDRWCHIVWVLTEVFVGRADIQALHAAVVFLKSLKDDQAGSNASRRNEEFVVPGLVDAARANQGTEDRPNYPARALVCMHNNNWESAYEMALEALKFELSMLIFGSTAYDFGLWALEEMARRYPNAVKAVASQLP